MRDDGILEDSDFSGDFTQPVTQGAANAAPTVSAAPQAVAKDPDLLTEEDFGMRTPEQQGIVPGDRYGALPSLGLGAAQSLAKLAAFPYNIASRFERTHPQIAKIIDVGVPGLGRLGQMPLYNPAFAPQNKWATLGGIGVDILPWMIPGFGEAKALELAPGFLRTAARVIAPRLKNFGIGATQAAIDAAGREQQPFLPSVVIGGAVSGMLGEAAPILRGLSKTGMAQRAYQTIAPRLEAITAKYLPEGVEASKIPQELYGRAKQYYEEKMGYAKPGEYRYIQPEQSVNSAYDAFTNAAADLKLPFNRGSFDNAVGKEIGSLQSELERVGGETTQKGSKIQQTINQLEDYKKIRLNDFSDAKALQEDLNQDFLAARESDDRRLTKVFHRIKEEGVKKSIDDTASQNPEIKQLLESANKQYGDIKETFSNKPGQKGGSLFDELYYSPAKEKDERILNFVGEHLKPGQQKDQYLKLERLHKMLPDEESRNLVTGWALKGAKTPEDFMKIYGKYGEEQKQLLFGADKEELDKYYNLFQKTKLPFKPPVEGGEGTKIFKSAAGAYAMGKYLHPALGYGAGVLGAGAMLYPKLAPKSALQRYIAGRLGGAGLGAFGRMGSAVLAPWAAGAFTNPIQQQEEY